MSEKVHPCPKCGGTMTYRLGEYQCGSCDYSEQAAAQHKEERGGGIHRHEQWQSGVGSTITTQRSGGYTGKLITPPDASSPASAPPPAFTGYEAPPAPPASGTLFGESSWEHREYQGGPIRDIGDTLAAEKRIWFLIYVILQSISIVVFLLLATVGRSLLESTMSAGGPPLSSDMAQVMALLPAGVVMLIIAMLIGIALTWWALFGTEIWAKWCCLGCFAWGVLMSIGQVFQALVPSALLMTAGPASQFGAVYAVFMICLAVVQMGFQGWLISILYRDIQQRQYR